MTEFTAYHEAGHALMALLLGGKVKHVTIEPEDDDGPLRHGDTKILWRRSGISEKDFAKKVVQVSLAGPVAEMIYTGDAFHPGLVPEWANDWRIAWESAQPLHPSERQRLAYLEQVSLQLYRQLKGDDLWSALAALADHCWLMKCWKGMRSRRSWLHGYSHSREQIMAATGHDLFNLVLLKS